MSYPGIGNPQDVLTVVGNNLKFQVPVSGLLGVTVAGSIPAQFTTVGAAAAAGNNIINVIGSTSEPSDISVDASGLNIKLYNSAEVDMNNNSFVWASNGDLALDGNGRISFNYSTNDTLFNVGAFSGKANVEGVRIANISSASGALVDGIESRFSDIVFEGDVILEGTRNKIVGCNVQGNFFAQLGSLLCKAAACQFDGTIVDFGSGTVISDTDSY